jgi:hypothetical protein
MGKPTKNQRLDEQIREQQQTRVQAAREKIAAILKEHNCELRAQLNYGTNAIVPFVAVVALPDETQKTAEEKAKEQLHADRKAKAPSESNGEQPDSQGA